MFRHYLHMFHHSDRINLLGKCCHIYVHYKLMIRLLLPHYTNLPNLLVVKYTHNNLEIYNFHFHNHYILGLHMYHHHIQYQHNYTMSVYHYQGKLWHYQYFW